MEEKTLREIRVHSDGCNCEKKIREEAINWIKEDRKVKSRLHPDNMGTWEISIRRWMKRLNIVENDLK